MFIDGIPEGAPWPLIIRARFVYQLDAVIASTVVAQVGTLASVDLSRKLLEAAGPALEAGREKLAPEAHLAGLRAYADFWDWCGTPWPRRWPWPPKPRGREFDDLSDPAVGLVIEQAHGLVLAAGSPGLQQGLGAVLAEVGRIG